jgi:hypothetical protein
MTKVMFAGKDFKAMVAAVTRFPELGNFAGADLIHLEVSEGKATACTFGIVLARARVDAEGKLPLTGLVRRNIEGFASVCSEAAKVTLAKVDSQIVLTVKGREGIVAISDGKAFKAPQLKSMSHVPVTKELASRLNYLSDVALNDSSRADLCCVMLTPDRQAIACNQKTVASMKTMGKLAENVAVPLALSKIAADGDVLYAGAKETVLKSDIATYSMPSPVRAQKEYPLGVVRELAKQAKEEVLAVDGQKFATAILECATCLGQLARTEVIVDMVIKDHKLAVSSTNGGMRFTATIPVLSTEPADAEFRAPLEGLQHVVPFMGEKVVFSRGKHSDLFLGVGRGWVLFPAWQSKRKKKA